MKNKEENNTGKIYKKVIYLKQT